MNAGKTTPNSQGHRLGNSIAIRDAIEEQMEHIFNGNKRPQQALDEAVAKGNEDPAVRSTSSWRPARMKRTVLRTGATDGP